VEAQAVVPDGVDALVDPVQLSFADANRDRLGSESTAFELPPRHHPMLPSGYLSRQRIGSVAFCVHMDA
jgi:hypothetical protein